MTYYKYFSASRIKCLLGKMEDNVLFTLTALSVLLFFALLGDKKISKMKLQSVLRFYSRRHVYFPQ